MFMYKVSLVDSLGIHHTLEGVYTFDGYNELHREMYKHLPLTDHIGISNLYAEEGRTHVYVWDVVSA